MNRLSIGRALSLCAASVLVLTACIACTGSGATNHATEPTGPPVKGGNLNVAVTSDPTGLNPWRFTAVVDENIISNIYDRVITRDQDDYSLAPDIAKSWKVSKDGLTVTLNLQPGVTFSDGRPLTSKDLVFSIDQARDPAATRTAPLLTAVTKVEATDKSTVTLTLTRPDSELLQSLVLIYVAPDDPSAKYDTKPIGSGPFKLTTWDPNTKIVLTRNASYWQASRPYLDTVTFKVVSDESTALLQLQNGQVDVLGTVPFGQSETAKKSGLQIALPPKGMAGGYYELFLNTTRAPWSDQRVRQALSYAIDRPGIAKVLPGIYSPRSNPVPPASKNFSADATSYDKQDIAKAKELLKQAGHPNGVDGGELLVYSNLGADYKALAQVLQTSAAQAGIKFKIRLYDVATWADYVLTKQDFGVGLGAAVPHPNDYDDIAHTWGNQLGLATGWQKQEPAFYKLLASVRTDLSPAKYTADMKKLQDLAMAGLPIIVIGDRTIPVALAPKVHGFVAAPEDYLFFGNTWKQR